MKCSDCGLSLPPDATIGCPFCGSTLDMDGEPGFRDPGGRSALRVGVRRHACPTCRRPNMLTDADVARGYQCDRCADAMENGYDCY